MKWDDIRVALAVHRSGSLVGAGRALGLDPTTVGRRIQALETALGQPLFERSEKSLVSTDQGRIFLASAVQMEDALATATRRAAISREQQVVGDVRLTAVTSLYTHYLMPRFPQLRRIHPGIRLDMIGSTEQFNLAHRDADLAVRMAKPEDGDLFVRRAAEIGFALYAADSLVERQGDDPAQLPWVRHQTQFKHLPEAEWAERHFPDVTVAAKAQVGLVMATAVENGLGVAVMPCYIADRSPALRRLSDVVITRDAWLVVHRDMRTVPRIRAVSDWLFDTMIADAKLFAGK